MSIKQRSAIREVLENYFTPDSPEGLAGAMYQLRKIYEAETRRIKTRRRTTKGKRGGADSENVRDQYAPGPLGKARPGER